MCDLKSSCAFYNKCNYAEAGAVHKMLHKLLIETYCLGDFRDVCRRKSYEEEMGVVPPPEFGPNGYHLTENKRIY